MSFFKIMKKSASENVFKSWSGISEEALIKEVATKGEHIQLCIEYLAKKREQSVEDYTVFFYDVIDNYVKRLLNERLFCKAEDVLRNVQSSIKCFIYQFAYECTDAELREEILTHFRNRKDQHRLERETQKMQFYLDVLQQLQQQPTLLDKCKTKLNRVNLETFMNSDKEFRNKLFVELYFANENAALLKYLDKQCVWEFLIETENIPKIIRWCAVLNFSANVDTNVFTALEFEFSQWPIESEMYELALKKINVSDDALRDCFAKAGYFFEDERDNVQVLLHRICSTESFDVNADLLKRLPIGRHLLERRCFYPMLENFVTTRELEELASENVEHRQLLELIITLKTCEIEYDENLQKISQKTKIYLESQGVDFQNEQPLVSLFEFLSDEPTIPKLNSLLNTPAFQKSVYFQSLSKRLDTTNTNVEEEIPTPYELFLKFEKIDFKELTKDIEGIASFSNERLVQKYGRKYQVNFLHYLKQERSAYAVYHLLMEQLQNYGQITQTQLFSASETVTGMAIQYMHNTELVTHCCAFLEMLGFDSQNLRNYLKLCRLVKSNGVSNYKTLITQVDEYLAKQLTEDPNTFPLADYQALMRLVACNQYRHWPMLVLEYYAKNNDWWHLLVLLQYFSIPLNVIREICTKFSNKNMGEHIFRALAFEVPPCKRSSTSHKRHSGVYMRQMSNKMRNKIEQTNNSSVETVHSSQSSTCNDGTGGNSKTACNSPYHYHQRFLPDPSTGEIDLIAIILMSTTTVSEDRIRSVAKFLEVMQSNQLHATSVNLLKNCIKFQMPLLAILAASVYAENVNWCWLVWLTVTIKQWTELLHVATKETHAHELYWQIIEKAVGMGCTSALYKSFFIFYESNPLIHFFEFLCKTQIFHDFSDENLAELILFLLSAITWNNEGMEMNNAALNASPIAHFTSQQLIQRCIKLLLIHVQRNFDSTAEQQIFIECICKSDISDISSLFDFCLLKEIFDIMQNASSFHERFSINFEQLLQSDNNSKSNTNNNNNTEYRKLLNNFLEAKKFDAAIHLSLLLQLPICDIVYSKWVDGIDSTGHLQLFDEYNYEAETEEYALAPEILVNFFLYAASCLKTDETTFVRKYQLLKRALNVIKKHRLFPNESFDRDQIEYEMITYYLKINITTETDELEKLEIYHSEYFEEIMLKERCVLYKSFLELKELAGIDDLYTSNKTPLDKEMRERLETLLNRLLDEGDIVEALRLQELFEVRPVDLRFVVFCMALAEGVTTVLNLTLEERQQLSEIEKSSFAKFNKRILGNLRHSGGSSSGNQTTSMRVISELSDSSSTLDFEEIPTKVKRETLETIQGIASRLKFGVDIGKRIFMAYRAAIYLDKEYLDVLRTKDVTVLLKSVAEDGCLHRLLVVSDILTSTQMTGQEIADLLAYEITTAIIRPRFNIFNSVQQAKNKTVKNADIWGYNIDSDFHLFLELTPNTTILGYCLLDYCDALKIYRKFQDDQSFEPNSVFDKLVDIIILYGFPKATSSSGNVMSNSITQSATSTAVAAGQLQFLSHKKQNFIYVELLIKAHQCFVHECSMEGIANVLNRVKMLNTILTKAKSWTLIVNMLIGIGRYREMYYCFDTLMKNEQFESLLGQFNDGKTVGFRQAILSYLREDTNAEKNKEYRKMTAMHFAMYKDLAEIWEQDAKYSIMKILKNFQVNALQLQDQLSLHSLTTSNPINIVIPKFGCSSDLVVQLQQTLQYYTNAAENYLLDNNLLLAQKMASQAELIATQIDLATKSLEQQTEQTSRCVCLLNVETRNEFRELVNTVLSVPQTLILGRAYGYDISWAEVLLMQFVVQAKADYRQQYLQYFDVVNDTIIENIVNGYQLFAQHNKITQQMETHLAQLVESVESITLKYKLASVLSFKSIITEMLNGPAYYYLKDTNYGRNNNNMNDES